MASGIDREATAARLGELAREAMTASTADPLHASGRTRLMARVAVERPARRTPAWMLAAASLAAAAILAVVLWPRAQLTYLATGADIAQGGYVAAPSSGSASVRFSDGSDLALAASGRTRIADVTPNGARIVLESGRAHARIVHRSKASWTIEAGPFAVAVTGTEFDVAWTNAALEVTMQAGSVLVSGPLAPNGVALQAGQQLVANPSTGDLKISTVALAPGAAGDAPPTESLPASVAAPTQTASGPGVGAAASAAVGTAPIPRATDAPPTTSWAKRVAAGEYRAVLDEAEQRGLDACLTQCALTDLAALGDAARYVGNTGVASRALQAERSRFAASPEAYTAAFLLGRLAEDRGDAAGAIGWYDRYLSESAAGPLAAEALGRKMLAVRRSAGDGAARSIARQYLARFPGGAHASVAKELAPETGGDPSHPGP